MQADAVISFPLFKHKPMPCHVYISLSKRRPKAPKRSHSSLEVYPSLKSLAQSLRGVAAISSCVADLLRGLWHIAEGPPKRVVSKLQQHNRLTLRSHAGQLAVSCHLLGLGRSWHPMQVQDIWGYLCLTLQPFLSNRALLNLHLRL